MSDTLCNLRWDDIMGITANNETPISRENLKHFNIYINEM